MRSSMLWLFVSLALCFSGCITTRTVEVAETPPSYVYAYPEGCWADDAWYPSPCPWTVGPEYGYYSWYGGVYYWQPHYVWEYRHRPPPRNWHQGPHFDYGHPTRQPQPHGGRPHSRH